VEGIGFCLRAQTSHRECKAPSPLLQPCLAMEALLLCAVDLLLRDNVPGLQDECWSVVTFGSTVREKSHRNKNF
jgi:hypothetical protein